MPEMPKSSKTVAQPPSWYAVPLLFSLALLLACGLLPSDSSTSDSQPAANEPAKVAVTADPVELEYWSSIKDSTHGEDFASYLQRYPEGAFADLAQSRFDRLNSPSDETAILETPEIVTEISTTQPPTVDVGHTNPPNSGPAAGGPSAGGGRLSGGPPGRNNGDYRSQRENIARDAIFSSLRGFSDRRLHLAPNIPRFKLDNVASLHGLDSSRVILLFDDGAGGGGKTGFCLTDRRIYWRFIAGGDPLFLDYEEVRRVRADRTSFTVNGYEVPTSLASNPSLAAQRFADMIEEIRYQLEGR